MSKRKARELSKVDCNIGPWNGLYYVGKSGKKTYLSQNQLKWPYIEKKCESGSSIRLGKKADRTVVVDEAAWRAFIEAGASESTRYKDKKNAKREGYAKFTKADLVRNPYAERKGAWFEGGLYKKIGNRGVIGGYVLVDGKYKWRIVAQEKAQSEIEKNVQDATFDLGSLSSIDVAVAANPLDEEVVLDQVYFSVIAGSFRSEENAEKKVVDLKAEGYPAAHAQINPEGLYRVAYGRYTSKKEAINMLYFLKYTLEEEAWYLEER